MTFESIFDVYKPQYKVALTEDKHKSISLVEEKPFYVKPQLNDIQTHQDSKIIVISAPGATGKSALARYLAYQYSSIYWDLSQTTVGDMTFFGELVASVGVENFSEYLINLIAGNTFLVIDAFDEAEMISGPKAIKNFLIEVNKQISKAKQPCVILLSRTETAQNICSTYIEAGVNINHYEISFFEDSASKEFVFQKVQQLQKKKNIRGSSPDITLQCIEQYLANIRALVPEEERGSFVGYAPVLEVIGEDIAQEQNAYSYLQEMQRESEIQGIEVVGRIIDRLVARESEKVQKAFEQKITEQLEAENEIDFSKFYCKDEQLIRVISYIVYGGFDAEEYITDGIPAEYLDDYFEVIRTFLPQHPFIRISATCGMEFAGPAFRDYTLSDLMRDGKQNELVECYFAEKRIAEHFPSHLLWKFFTMNDPEQIVASKVPFLFESFKSQARQPYVAQLSIVGTEEGGYSSTWSLSTPSIKDCLDLDSYELLINEDGLALENLVNVFMDVDCHVTLRNDSRSVRISNGTVICKKLDVIADSLVIDAHEETPCIIVSKEDAKFQNTAYSNTDITVNGNNLQIDIPNYKFVYRLSKYQESFSEESDFSINLFIYLLRKIFVQFRKHRKDAPARDAEMIDFIIIGQNPQRKAVFNFLKSKDIIFQDGDTHLYKINVNKMADAGISYGALTRGDTSQLQEAYSAFTVWYSRVE